VLLKNAVSAIIEDDNCGFVIRKQMNVGTASA
jgi:hypothetical protein